MDTLFVRRRHNGIKNGSVADATKNAAPTPIHTEANVFS
jgi:hypothetical protein